MYDYPECQYRVVSPRGIVYYLSIRTSHITHAVVVELDGDEHVDRWCKGLKSAQKRKYLHMGMGHGGKIHLIPVTLMEETKCM